jgi:hypothetical protein
MLAKLKRLTAGRRQLLASLFFNFLAKVPGLAAVLLILPIISRKLGPSLYGEMLSALALGSTFTVVFGGGNAVGRRLLAGAVGRSDRDSQATVFITTTALMASVAVVLVSGVLLFGAGNWSSPALAAVSVLPVIAAFLNTFDNLRASFNEHYVTALLQFVLQVAIYALVMTVGIPAGNALISGLVVQSPFALASRGTLILLIIQRPYLLAGKVSGMSRMIMPAVGVVLADGVLSALLNFSVYWLGRSGATDYAAWVGTFMRLFTSFSSPIVLLLFPITSYVAIRWPKLTADKRIRLLRLFVAGGLAYGALIGALVALLGPLYISHMFHLPETGDGVDIASIAIFMGAIMAQKAVSLLLYSVSEAKFLSYGTAAVSLIALLLAAASVPWLQPNRVVDVLYALVGLLLPTISIAQYLRQSRLAGSPAYAPESP